MTRNAYESFGARRGGDNLAVSRGWLGQVEDADTGLTYLNARYYDPASMRFISPDPLMNPADPKTLDPYRYADNNPVMFTDASGLSPLCIAITTTYEDCRTIGERLSPGDDAVSRAKAGFVDGFTDRAYATGYAFTPAGFRATVAAFQDDVRDYGFMTAIANPVSAGVGGDDLVKLANCASGPVVCDPYDIGHTSGGLGFTYFTLAMSGALRDPYAGETSVAPVATFAEAAFSGLAPITKGRMGILQAVAELEASGHEVIAREVMIDVSVTVKGVSQTVRVRPDLLVKTPEGLLQFVEVKNGPFAKLTRNQRLVFTGLGELEFTPTKSVFAADLVAGRARSGVGLRVIHYGREAR